MNNHLSKADLYSDAYKSQVLKFNESKLKERLAAKYEVKPYYLANKKLYSFSKFCSLVFNLLSISTSFSFVLSLISGSSFLLSVVLALSVLGIIEALKQFLIPDVAKIYFQFDTIPTVRILFCSALICLSAFASYKGANLAVQTTTKAPELISQDSIKSAYNSKIEALEAKQAELAKVKYKGITTRTAQKAINEIQVQINSLTGLLSNDLNQATLHNANETNEHKKSTSTNAWYFAILALIFDFGLLCCLVYCEYYDYRSLCDFVIVGIERPLKKDLPKPENFSDPEPDSDSGTDNVQTGTDNVQTIKTGYPQSDCLNCGTTFEKKNPKKKYCSDACRLQFYNRKNAKPLII